MHSWLLCLRTGLTHFVLFLWLQRFLCWFWHSVGDLGAWMWAAPSWRNNDNIICYETSRLNEILANFAVASWALWWTSSFAATSASQSPDGGLGVDGERLSLKNDRDNAPPPTIQTHPKWKLIIHHSEKSVCVCMCTINKVQKRKPEARENSSHRKITCLEINLDVE